MVNLVVSDSAEPNHENLKKIKNWQNFSFGQFSFHPSIKYQEGTPTIQILLNCCNSSNVYKINPSIATVKFKMIILNKNKIKIQ
jgi:hypothetical protein